MALLQFMCTPSPLQTIQHPLFKQFQLNVYIKRDDLIHPIISGNKWRKLKYNLLHAKSTGKQGILSFGGPYSNHIHALAFACKEHGLESVGIIRGEQHYRDNATLSAAQQWGMEFSFVDRKTYRRRHEKDYLDDLQRQYPHFHIVPEGGSNSLALAGVGEIIKEIAQEISFDTLILPTGSSGTLAGLVQANSETSNKHHIIGVAVLKNAEYLNDSVQTLVNTVQTTHLNSWQLLTDYHRGGYAKFSKNDEEKILAFSSETKIPFEPIYSGKMLLAFLELVEQGFFPVGQRIVMLHTGGLQGLAGLAEQGKLALEKWTI